MKLQKRPIGKEILVVPFLDLLDLVVITGLDFEPLKEKIDSLKEEFEGLGGNLKNHVIVRRMKNSEDVVFESYGLSREFCFVFTTQHLELSQESLCCLFEKWKKEEDYLRKQNHNLYCEPIDYSIIQLLSLIFKKDPGILRTQIISEFFSKCGIGKSKIKSSGHVYILEKEPGLIKIGCSIEPIKRIESLCSIFGIEPSDFWISPKIGNFHRIEARLHRLFRNSNIKNEWFNVDFDLAVVEAENLTKPMVERKTLQRK